MQLQLWEPVQSEMAAAIFHLGPPGRSLSPAGSLEWMSIMRCILCACGWKLSLDGMYASAASCNKWWSEEILKTKDFKAEQESIRRLGEIMSSICRI